MTTTVVGNITGDVSNRANSRGSLQRGSVSALCFPRTHNLHSNLMGRRVSLPQWVTSPCCAAPEKTRPPLAWELRQSVRWKREHARQATHPLPQRFAHAARCQTPSEAAIAPPASPSKRLRSEKVKKITLSATHDVHKKDEELWKTPRCRKHGQERRHDTLRDRHQ